MTEIPTTPTMETPTKRTTKTPTTRTTEAPTTTSDATIRKDALMIDDTAVPATTREPREQHCEVCSDEPSAWMKSHTADWSNTGQPSCPDMNFWVLSHRCATNERRTR